MTAAAVVFLVCLVACLWPAAAWSKSYSIERIDIGATVRADGSLAIVEKITYAFNGDFTFAFRNIPLKPGETISDIGVRDVTAVYRRAADKSPGTYTVSAQGSATKITWYYRVANQQHTFEFSYVIGGVVERHPDVAELYYKFVGDDWDRWIREVRVTLHPPPGGVSRADVRAWAHGPLNGTVAIEAGGVVRLNVSVLPARTFWEGRVLYPAERFPEVIPSGSGPRLGTIMNEERVWAEEANRRREARIEYMEQAAAERARKKALAGKFILASVFVVLGCLLWWYRNFQTHGMPHRVTAHTVPGEIPSAHRPAILSYLLYRTVSGSAIVATLLDLADRGYFTITETMKEKKGWFGRTSSKKDYRFDLTEKRMADLVPFEMQLVEFMITKAGDATGFTMSGLKKEATRHRTAFRKWFMKWTKEIKELGKTMNFYEPYPARAMAANAIVGAIVLGAGVVCSLIND